MLMDHDDRVIRVHATDRPGEFVPLADSSDPTGCPSPVNDYLLRVLDFSELFIETPEATSASQFEAIDLRQVFLLIECGSSICLDKVASERGARPIHSLTTYFECIIFHHQSVPEPFQADHSAFREAWRDDDPFYSVKGVG